MYKKARRYALQEMGIAVRAANSKNESGSFDHCDYKKLYNLSDEQHERFCGFLLRVFANEQELKRTKRNTKRSKTGERIPSTADGEQATTVVMELASASDLSVSLD